MCVLLLQVNLCEAVAIPSFICRQVWQHGGREGREARREEEEGAGGEEKDRGEEKEGEQ